MDVFNAPAGDALFGESTMAEVAELRKALSIGYTQPTTGQGFDALRVESLESTLKVLTYQMEDMNLWSKIPKKGATSTVEEFNRLLSYGSDAGGFNASGALPETEDSVYERADQKVKYMGTTREVHHPATLVGTVPPDVVGQETINGAIWLMGKANNALYYADADAIPLSFNGIAAQIEDGGGTIVDMRGLPLSQDTFENLGQTVVDNFGRISKLFSNGRVFTDFSKLFHATQRHITPPAKAGIAGTPMTGYQTINGVIEFEADMFVRAGLAALAAASSSKAPTAPTVSPGTPGATTGSQFVTADAGTYKYQVSAVNNYGESLPTAATANVTLAAGEGVVLTITDGGGTYGATAYRIYRTNKGSALPALGLGILVPRNKIAGVYQATTTWTDKNDYLPGTFMGIAATMDSEVFCFKQLLPMVKMDLARIAPSVRWMQLMYGTPIVYAPKKMAIIRNIGVAA